MDEVFPEKPKRNTKRKRGQSAVTGRMVVIVMLCFGALILFRMAERILFPSVPSDQELLERFYAHRDEFEELERLFIEGGLSANTSQTVQYPALLDALNLEWEQDLWTAGSGNSSVRLRAGSGGLLGHGEAKGYLYTLERLGTVDDLDAYRAEPVPHSWAFRHIEGNWYLYYEYCDTGC